MQEKHLKFAMIGLLGLGGVALVAAIVGGGSDRRQGTYNVSVVQQVQAADGLDLRAVGDLLSKVSSAQEFEKKLNEPGNSVNNLDLNEDGKVDYIKVAELGDTQNADKTKVQGFALSTELEGGEVQELATIKVEKQEDGTAAVETHGAPAVYGQNHYYHSTWQPGFGTGLMMGYLFAPRATYVSPYGWGSYPPAYSSYAPVPHSTYERNTAAARSSGNFSSASSSRLSSSAQSLRSPYAGRNASNVKAPLRQPTASQRSFQARQPRSSASSRARSGGFGSGSVRSGSYGRSTSFGGK